MHNIGKTIKELRKGRKLTQSELGKLLSVSDKAISSYETNIATPPAATLREMAGIFNVSIDYIMGTKSRTKKEVILGLHRLGYIDEEVPEEVVEEIHRMAQFIIADHKKKKKK
jgi:transcriptional regulator with XRE-family HTH domain